jgi:hypothetical protein
MHTEADIEQSAERREYWKLVRECRQTKNGTKRSFMVSIPRQIFLEK